MGHMDDLVQFLLNRLAIEEHVARGARPGPWHVNAEADEVMAVDGVTVADGFALSGQQLRATTEHIARHNPARVLREIEAKREIVRQANLYLCDSGPGCGYRTKHGHNVLRLLALPYADHPDYQETWRP